MLYLIWGELVLFLGTCSTSWRKFKELFCSIVCHDELVMDMTVARNLESSMRWMMYDLFGMSYLSLTFKGFAFAFLNHVVLQVEKKEFWIRMFSFIEWWLNEILWRVEIIHKGQGWQGLLLFSLFGFWLKFEEWLLMMIWVCFNRNNRRIGRVKTTPSIVRRRVENTPR